MTLYVMDTDHLSLFDRNHPVVVSRVLTSRQTVSEKLSTTVVSLEEQVKGRLAQISKAATNPEHLILAYQRLSTALNVFDGLMILDYNAVADGYFREFRKAGVRVGTQDLRIASIVLAHGGVLLTRNRRDFEKVAGLSFQD
ncbi:MAG: type II toxin-antitoxin system VapC family toxin [Cyanobacteria bacterium P01_D01_bin.36]